MITITIDTENDAFVEDFDGELERLLLRILDDCVTFHAETTTNVEVTLVGTNGNRVGKMDYQA